ncbi:unnamed protein product [Onchocerca flexuosa]|uniref:DUF4091 domain-containing protein n=1 Tax=Onchocerca flexuosa TaxID=387005 RepID=A0A183HSM2_9BILA|nr:unnamed protein product [Onchocerca flexuosa]
MQQMQRDDQLFTLGDGRMYDGYDNWPLDSNTKYRLMMRAFTRDDIARNSDHPVNFFKI